MLIELLEEDESDVRARAAMILGHIGPFAEGAGGRLESIAEDPEGDGKL